MRVAGGLFIMFVMAGCAWAQSPGDERGADRRAAAKEKWAAMSPDEKAAAKKKAREKWDSMTPEQKAAVKKRLADRNPELAAKMAEKKNASPPSPDPSAPSAGK